MPSIFLSHTSVDKPFVEKLAKDLTRLGVKVWFDKWEIKVGESLTWKIEAGIRENEYLGVVLTPQSLESEWVKHELSAGLIKQLTSKKVVLLPILYRNCDIPLFIQDRKYADFRDDYNEGFKELADVFGIKNTELIGLNNWRRFKTDKSADWKKFREEEFSLLVTRLIDLSIDFNWSSWVGGTKLPFSICLHPFLDQHIPNAVTVRLDGKTNGYVASLKDCYNPNLLKVSDFDIPIGNTINEVEEYVWRIMEDFKSKHGKPLKKQFHHSEKFTSADEKLGVISDMVKKMDWYKGTKK